MIPVRENSEVVMKFTQKYIYIYITKEMDMILMYINGILYDIS